MIEIKNLTFSYSKQPPYLFHKLSLTIHRGDYLSILGDNGSGKSTLIKLILKLLPPTEGTIISQTNKIGYVPQRFENLNTQFPITVYEILDCYRKSQGIKDKIVIDSYLEYVNMRDCKHALFGTLSSGQCQKIFIARALLGSPDLLVLDEPSTGVDAKSQAEIYALIKSINRNHNITVISVEHNLKAATDNSSLIYHLYKGHGHLCKPEEYIREYIAINSGEHLHAAI